MNFRDCNFDFFPATQPVANEVWRAKDNDFYLKIVDVDQTSGIVTVACTDIGKYAHLKDCQPYTLSLGELQRTWRRAPFLGV